MRPLWFVAGTAAGVYATTKVRRAAENLTVDGLHDRLTGWFAGARVLRDEVRSGMAEKETELRQRIDAVPDGDTPRQLTRGRHLELARERAARPGDSDSASASRTEGTD
jgi:hypothetical protein